MREDPYGFKRSTSFLGIFLCWSRCQHAQNSWLAMSVTSTHAHGDGSYSQFPIRLANSSGHVTVWPGYADFYFTEMQTFAYSPAPVSGGSLRSLIYPGNRRLDRPFPVWIFHPRCLCTGVCKMRVSAPVQKHVFWRYPPKTPISGVPANPPFRGPPGVSKQ